MIWSQLRSQAAMSLAIIGIIAGQAIISGPARGDFVTFDNGPFITGPVAINGSFTPPAGTAVSEVQTQVGNINLGFSGDAGFITRLADDFTLAVPTLVNGFRFFGYEQNSGTTSPFTGVTLRIFDRDPSMAGAVILAGDTVSNLISSTGFADAFRIRNPDNLNTQRPIMRIDAALTAPIALAAGTYWVDYNLASVPGNPVNFTPPVTLVGQSQKAGANALIFNGAWAAIVDSGSGAAQDIPFQVFSTPEPSSWAMSLAVIGGLGAMTLRRRRVS